MSSYNICATVCSHNSFQHSRPCDLCSLSWFVGPARGFLHNELCAVDTMTLSSNYLQGSVSKRLQFNAFGASIGSIGNSHLTRHCAASLPFYDCDYGSSVLLHYHLCSDSDQFGQIIYCGLCSNGFDHLWFIHQTSLCPMDPFISRRSGHFSSSCGVCAPGHNRCMPQGGVILAVSTALLNCESHTCVCIYG